MSAKVKQELVAANDPVPLAPMSMAVPTVADGMVSMIERVLRDPSIPLERLERLLEIKERMRADEARLAFDAAFAEMQPNLPIVDERGQHGGTKSTYAKWDDVIESVTKILGKFGFSVRFRIKQDEKTICITGKLSHVRGHFEETSIVLPFDGSGQKNPVQAIASSQSYGQRYVLKALVAFASRKSDDDNGDAAGGGGPINDTQCANLIKLMDEVGVDKAKFCNFFHIDGVAMLPAAKFQQALSMCNAKKARR